MELDAAALINFAAWSETNKRTFVLLLFSRFLAEVYETKVVPATVHFEITIF